MKSWKIHFGWSIVTVLAVSVAARVTGERPAPRAEKRETTGPAAADPVASSPVVPAALLPESPVSVAPQPPPSPATLSPAERVRALLIEPNYWQALTDALDAIPDRSEKLRLMKEMMENPKGNGRYVALFALSKMKGRDVAEVLENALILPSVPTHFRRQVVDAIGKVGDPGSVPILYETLSDADDDLRVSCAASLLKLGQMAPANGLMTTLARLYDSPDGSLRKKAIEQIAQLHPEGALPVLIRALRDSNGEVRLEALYAVTELKKPELLPLIQPLVEDPNPDVAKEAREYVDSLKSEKE